MSSILTGVKLGGGGFLSLGQAPTGQLVIPYVNDSAWGEALTVKANTPTQSGEPAIFVAGTFDFEASLNRANPFAVGRFRPYLAKFKSDLSLDTTFGTGGISVIEDYRVNAGVPVDADWEAADIAILANGQILVSFIDYYHDGGGFIWGYGVAKFNTDGTLDATFATSGVYTFYPLPGAAEYWAQCRIAVRSDGKILLFTAQNIAGGTRCDLRCLNADGTVYTAFGGGAQPGSFLKQDVLTGGLVVQSDDKVVICGGFGTQTFGGDQQIYLARIKTDGTLDTTFGTSGETKITGPFNYARGVNLVQQADNSLVVVGMAKTDATHYGYMAAGFTSSGALDTSFGTSGITTGRTQFAGSTANDQIGGQAVFLDGAKIVAVGYSYTSSSYYDPTSQGFAVRFNSNGSLDSSFGTSGLLSFGMLAGDTEGNQQFYGACLWRPDNYLFAGHMFASLTSVSQACLGRMIAGYLPTTVNTNGTGPSVTTDAASSVGVTTATANATINPHSNATSWRFVFGLTSGRYTRQTSIGSAGSGSSGAGVTLPITGLSSGQTYYGRAAAWSAAGGLTFGSEVSFTTS